MIRLAIRVTSSRDCCIAVHTAAALPAGMTPGTFCERMANETKRLANGCGVPIDDELARG